MTDKRRSYRYANGGPSAQVTTGVNRLGRRGWVEHGPARLGHGRVVPTAAGRWRLEEAGRG